MNNLEQANVGVQTKGRLTQQSLRWLNEMTGSNFPDTEEPFGKVRKLTDKETGITVFGFSNGDTIKAAAKGYVDVAFAGLDKVSELRRGNDPLFNRTITLAEPLGFGVCRMVLAQPEDADPGLPMQRVVTTYPNLTRDFLRVMYGIAFPSTSIDVFGGSIETIAALGGYDGIVDVTETGEALTKNGLVEVDEVLKSQAVLIGSGIEACSTSSSCLQLSELGPDISSVPRQLVEV